MASISNITFACENPPRMARFWAAALDYEIQTLPPDLLQDWLAAGHDEDEAAAIVDPKGQGPRLFFQRMDKRPEVPNTSIPIHLDLHSRDPQALVDRLTSLGATLVAHRSRRIGDTEDRWIEMRDPEANGFCIESPA